MNGAEAAAAPRAASETEEGAAPAQASPEWKERFRQALLAQLIYLVARLIGLTLRVRFVNGERLERTVRTANGAILVTWHGRTLVPANTFRGRGYWALISLSRDGQIQDRIFRKFGYQTIRGSTGRGGIKATLQLARKVAEGGVLAFTPDGPRGPSHVVQPGTVFLAQRSGRPVLPLGISARPRLLLSSWDRYMIPYPFAKVTFVIGDPIFLSDERDEAEREQAAVLIREAINRCEREADESLGFRWTDPAATPEAPAA